MNLVEAVHLIIYLNVLVFLHHVRLNHGLKQALPRDLELLQHIFFKGQKVSLVKKDVSKERPYSGVEFSPSSSLKLNLCLRGNMEEKAQKSQVENICSSSKCNYIKKDDIKGCPTAMVDNEQIIANSFYRKFVRDFSSKQPHYTS